MAKSGGDLLVDVAHSVVFPLDVFLYHQAQERLLSSLSFDRGVDQLTVFLLYLNKHKTLLPDFCPISGLRSVSSTLFSGLVGTQILLGTRFYHPMVTA